MNIVNPQEYSSQSNNILTFIIWSPSPFSVCVALYFVM